MTLEKKLQTFILVIVIGFMPIVVCFQFATPYLTTKELFFQLNVSVLLFFTAIHFILGKKIHTRFNIIDSVILLFLFFAVVSNCRLSHGFSRQLQNLIFLVVFYFLLQHVLNDYSNSENRIIRLLFFVKILSMVVILVSFVEAVYGLLQFMDIDMFEHGGSLIYESKVIGTIGHPNWMGGYLAVGFPFAVYLFLNCKRMSYRIAVGIVSLIILVALALTLSRGAWIALIAGIFVFLLPNLTQSWKKTNASKSIKKFILLISIPLVLFSFWQVVKINPESAAGRLFIWKVSWGMVQDFPVFGIGYGDYPVQYLHYQTKFFSHPENTHYSFRAANLKDAHNEYMQILAETGIIGLVLFLLMCFVFYVAALKVYYSVEREEIKLILRLCLSGMLIVFIHSLVDTPLRQLPVSILFFFYVAVISLLCKSFLKSRLLRISRLHKSQTSIRVSFSIKRIISVLFGILLLVLSVDLMSGSFDKAKGYKHWREGQKHLFFGDWQTAINEYRRAINVLPDEGELHFHLAGGYVYAGKFKEALGELKKAKINFNDKNIYYCEGFTYEKLGNYGKAEEDYKYVKKMFPSHLLPNLFLAKLYYEIGHVNDALLQLQTIKNANPEITSMKVKMVKSEARKLSRFYLSAAQK